MQNKETRPNGSKQRGGARLPKEMQTEMETGMESGRSLFIDGTRRWHGRALSVRGPAAGEAPGAAHTRTRADDPEINLSQVVVR